MVCITAGRAPLTTDGNPCGNVRNSSGLDWEQRQTMAARHIRRVCCQSKYDNVEENWVWMLLNRQEIKQSPPET